MEADTHPGGPTWLPLLSLRFWTFFAAAFGLTGLLLSAVGLGALASFAVALPNAIGLATAVAWFFRTVRQEEVSGDTDLAYLTHQEARVLLPIRPGELGKIAIQTMAGRVELPARTRDARPIEPGAWVLIASVEGGTAEVTRLPDAARSAPPQSTRH
jgi:hypothetical protein